MPLVGFLFQLEPCVVITGPCPGLRPRVKASLDPTVAARAEIAIARTVNVFIVVMALSPVFKKSGDRFFTELVECRRRKGCAGHHNRVDCPC